MDFSVILLIYLVLTFVATIVLLAKAGVHEEYGIAMILFPPLGFHKAVFGSGWWLLLSFAIAMAFVSWPSLITLIILFVWNTVFSISLAKAYLSSAAIVVVLFVISSMFFPGITWLILAFVGGEYRGPVDLLWFIRDL